MRKVNKEIRILIIEDIATQIFNLNRGLTIVVDTLLFMETLSGESSFGRDLRFATGHID